MAESATRADLTTTEAVARRLRGGATDWRGVFLEGALLLSLLVSLGVLLVLLADIVVTALPVLTDRPVDFLTSPMSARA